VADLEGEEAKEPPQEARDGATLAAFVRRPGRRQTGEVFGGFGVEGDDGNRTRRRMDPGDQGEAPVGGRETVDARPQSEAGWDGYWLPGTTGW
jgi:hypothetical protein